MTAKHLNWKRDDDSTLLKALPYCRVSSESQIKKGDGLGSQETRCREYSAYKGYPVERVFYDRATSGKLLDRPGIKELLQFLRRTPNAHEYVVVFDDISRLARDIRTHLDLRDAIIETGAQIDCPTVEFREDAHGRYFEEMQALSAQHHRRHNAEQTLQRMRARAMKGYWPFRAPPGYFMKDKVPVHGHLLVRDEPMASILQEALQGFASGRFETQSELKTFLEAQPGFTVAKKNGEVRYEDVIRILRRPHYAGYIEFPKWDVAMRKGHHEPLISLDEYNRIQERIKGDAKAPARKDIHNEFPLRGFVTCGDCEKPLTSCWSKSKTGKKHPYYMCFKKGCESYRKSIKRDDIEGSFQKIVKQLSPSAVGYQLTRDMFKTAWEIRGAQLKHAVDAARKEITGIERQVEQLLDRIVDTESPTTISAYERRIAKLEASKCANVEKRERNAAPPRGFEEMFELAMKFLASPWKIWNFKSLNAKKIVLRLAFSERLPYHRETGFRTPKTTLPFKVLRDICAGKNRMAETVGFEPTIRG